MQCIVLIEKKHNNYYIPHGTGFLVWNYKDPHLPIVVTCAHLLSQEEIFISVNADSTLLSWMHKQNADTLISKTQRWFIDKNKVRSKVVLENGRYSKHPNLDIAAFPLDIPRSEVKDDSGNIVLKFSNTLIIPKSMMKFRNEISLGDEVCFIGFPFGIGVHPIIEPLVRSGSISWKSDLSDEFLLDAFSFGGNSGSPIFLKRIFGTVPGVPEWENAKLIGMIVGHHGLILENVLTQPNPTILKFEKGSIELNLGLARCVWIDDIMTVVNMAENLTL